MKSTYLYGLAVLGGTLGPRGRNTILGTTVSAWDNTTTYNVGDVTYNLGEYYRAVRKVTPPFLPAIMDGDEPGKSDAWLRVQFDAQRGAVIGGRSIDQIYDDPNFVGEVYDVVLGMFDIGASQRVMNTLKQVPASVARALLKGGQDAINTAIAVVKAKKLNDGRDKTRNDVLWKLKWHADQIALLSGLDKTIYSHGDDLKTWVMNAFIEANAAEEGAAWVDAAWSRMWDAIAEALAALPAEIQAKVHQAASWAVETATGIPIWAWYGIIAGTVGLVGYGVYKVLRGPMGGAIGGVAARRYLP